MDMRIYLLISTNGCSIVSQIHQEFLMTPNRCQYEKILREYQGKDLIADLPELLLAFWQDDYRRTHGISEMVLVHLDGEGSSFTYLFDTTRQRVVGSAGLPTFVKHKRDKGRMAGHPLANSETYDRGHLLAHSLGGGADINLVPQLSKVNRGGFRRIERLVLDLASRNVQCVYFVRPDYPVESVPADEKLSQLPMYIEQGVVGTSRVLTYDLFKNN